MGGKTMKRILAMVVCVAILATVAITGSVAYFTDSDEAMNVFTVGNVVIEQHELKREDDVLEELTSNEKGQHELGMLHPMVEKTEGSSTAEWSFKTTDTASTTLNLRNPDRWANYVDKIVTVENKGKSEAYVRNIVAIPTGDVDLATVPWLEVDWFDASTKTNFDWEKPTVNDGTIIKGVDIDGVTYDIYVIYYKANEGKLATNTTTLPTLLGVGLSKYLDYDEDEGYYFLKDSTKTSVKFDPDDMKIYVATQAVQAAGFDTAEEAFNATFGTIDEVNHPWEALSHGYGYIENQRYNWAELKEKEYVDTITIDNKPYLSYIDPSLTELYINGNDVEGINNDLWKDGTTYALKTLTIGKGVERIENFAFGFNNNAYFTSLETVNLPSTPITIGKGAFKNCTALTQITIPGNVTLDNGGYQFSGCSKLETAIVEKGVTKIPENCFYDCTLLANVTLPDTVTEIDEYAFAYCKALGSITLPEGLEKIGNTAFGYCNILNNVSIPNSVTNMGTNVFTDCYGLTAVELPASFKGSSDLNSIIGKSGVTISYHS